MAKNKKFSMPKAVRITGRSSSITNSFVNGIIPVIQPSEEEVDEVLEILGMDEVVCSYCGGPSSEWDHFRPLVVDKQPTGYISEIHNLVPACGKCNQSKGNKDWRVWMYSAAPQSPKTRNIPDIDARAARLAAFESWGQPQQVDFGKIVGDDLWEKHWKNKDDIIALMKEAEELAGAIRERIAADQKPFRPPETVSAED